MIDCCPVCRQELPVSADLTVDLDYNFLVWKGIRVDLTPVEAEIMEVFRRAGHGHVTTEHMMEMVYSIGDDPLERTLRTHYTHIRHKLRAKQVPIEIIPTGRRRSGMGNYRLKYG